MRREDILALEGLLRNPFGPNDDCRYTRMGMKDFSRCLATVARCKIVVGIGFWCAVCFASARAAQPVEYCSQLKVLNNLAMSRERFSPVLGPATEGNYRATKLVLAGWTGCAFYGRSTYTCDSPELTSHEEATNAQLQIAKDILSCFEEAWAEASEQMGPDFIVLHPKLGPASITLNLDQTDGGYHLVRLILFLRR
jgi:hypothetical protein